MQALSDDRNKTKVAFRSGRSYNGVIMSSLGVRGLVCLLILAIGPANLCLCAAGAMPVKAAAKADGHSCCDQGAPVQKQSPEKCKHCGVASIVMAASAERANMDAGPQVAFAEVPIIQIVRDCVVDARGEGPGAVPLCRPLSDLVHTSCQLTV